MSNYFAGQTEEHRFNNGTRRRFYEAFDQPVDLADLGPAATALTEAIASVNENPMEDVPTIRQLYKMAAIQGMLAQSADWRLVSGLVNRAGLIADALIAEDKAKSPESPDWQNKE